MGVLEKGYSNMHIPENRLELIPIEEYHELERRLAAFNLRDIQTAITFMTWITYNEISSSMVVAYLFMKPAVDSLVRAGYFRTDNSLEHAKHVKALEKQLPKKMRSYFRKLRLRSLGEGASLRTTKG